MIDLHYPSTTFVGKPVPKNAFYRHLEVNAKMKQHFVDDVVAIKWLYKLAPSTLNVADGKEVHPAEGKYFFTLTITEIPVDLGELTFEVRTCVKDAQDTSVWGENAVFTHTMGQN